LVLGINHIPGLVLELDVLSESGLHKEGKSENETSAPSVNPEYA
jgi:hypothetical protein